MAVRESGDLGLAGGAEKLRHLALGSTRHRQRIKGCRNIRTERSRAAHKFGRGVTARRDADAFEVYRHWAFHGAYRPRARVLRILGCRNTSALLDDAVRSHNCRHFLWSRFRGRISFRGGCLLKLLQVLLFLELLAEALNL